MATKMTKKDYFQTLRTHVETFPDMFDNADAMLEFIDHEMEQLDKRTESAKKYAKKNTKAFDAMAEAIADVLMNNGGALTIPQIIEHLSEDSNATPQKLTYRLNKMVEAGKVIREMVSIKAEGKNARKVNSYKWVSKTGTETDIEE